MKKILPLFITMMVIVGCSETGSITKYYKGEDIIDVADLYIGLHERRDRKTLRNFVNVDPVNTEWCAAFMNSVLKEIGIPGSEAFSENPLMARSFVTWGEEVTDNPQPGDIVVFPRGNNGWQGHVGFFVVSFQENGREYYIILGGNQNDEVSYEAYEAKRAIAIRRWPGSRSSFKESFVNKSYEY